MTIAELNDHFAIPGHIEFDEHSGLIRIQIRLASADATVYLHGAHVTHWQPTGQKPALFLSSASDFEPGKPIRGGVPICFPWFGPRSDGGPGPSHGFARLQEWELAFAALVPDSASEAGDRVHLTFTLGSGDLSRELGFDHFRVAYEVIVGATLTLRLTVANLGTEPLHFEEALHTYFAVGDVRQTSLTGLESRLYFDKPDGMRVKTGPAEPLTFSGETDCVYPETVGPFEILDAGNARRIVIEKASSATTVVWNPAAKVAAKLPDLADDEWPEFLCVETANTAADAITLQPGESHSMSATATVEG